MPKRRKELRLGRANPCGESSFVSKSDKVAERHLFFDEEQPAEQRDGNVLRQVLQQRKPERPLLIDGKKRQRGDREELVSADESRRRGKRHTDADEGENDPARRKGNINPAGM